MSPPEPVEEAEGMDDNEEMDEQEGLNPEDILQVIPLDEVDFGDEDNEEENADEPEAEQLDPSKDGGSAVAEFSQHNDHVFTVDLNSVHDLIASGGQDDRLFVFGPGSSSSVPLEHTQFGDSVTHVRWHSTGRCLAAGDMSGVIKVWKFDANAVLKFACEVSTGADLEWMCWHAVTDILFAGCADGTIWMWLITGQPNEVPNCKVYAAGGNAACNVGMLLDDGRSLLAGYEDGTIRIWSLKDMQSQTCVVSGDAVHAPTDQMSASCTSVCKHPIHPIAAVGNELGAIIIVRTDLAHITGILNVNKNTEEAEMQSEEDEEVRLNSVESLCFSGSVSMCLCVGGVNGTLTVFDLNADGLVRHELQHPAGVVKCALTGVAPELQADHMCLTACLDGIVRMWDIRNGQLIRYWNAHRSNIYDLCVSTETQRFVTAGDDFACRLFALTPADVITQTST